MRLFALLTMCCCCLNTLAVTARAETVEAFGGAIKLETPKDWKSIEPKSRIIEKEYEISKEGSEQSARVTMMAAGGDIDANVARWIGQFSAPAGGAGKVDSKVEKFDAGNNEVHLVEISGTFKESMGGGPFFPGKTVERENYQMLGAIVVNDGRKFFIKMTGPQELVAKNKEAFKAMLKNVK